MQLPLRLRAFSAARHRVVAIVSEMPLLFFAVVVGTAIVFKLVIGLAKGGDAKAEPPALAMTDARGPGSGAAPALSFQPDPAAQPLEAASAAAGTGGAAGAGAGASPLGTATATPPRHHRHRPRAR